MATAADANTIALWRLDDDGSVAARDDTGVHNLATGTAPTGLAVTSAKLDRGLSFNGTSQFRSMASSSALDAARALMRAGVWSFSTWVQLSASPPAAEQVVFDYAGPAGSTGNSLGRVSFNASRVLQVSWENGTNATVGPVLDSAATVWATGTWYRLGVSVNIPGSSISFWRDGAKLSTVTTGWALPTGGESAVPFLGRHGRTATLWLKGLLDHCHLSKVAHDDATMAARAALNLVPTAPGNRTTATWYASTARVPGNANKATLPPLSLSGSGLTINTVSPTPGTELTTTTPIVVQVSDADAKGRIFLAFDYPLLGVREVAWDGTAFGPRFSGGTNQRVAGGTPGTYTFTLLRDGGWPEAPTLHATQGDV